MANTSDIAALAKSFFDAIERGDIETVRKIYAPDAVIWHNTDNLESTVEENLRVLTGFIANIPTRRYQNRRLDVFAGGFAQQHVLHGVNRKGQALTLAAALVCKVANGRITRLDEYFDSAAVAPWMEP
jgi:ketosteroid isomerase-like protein